MRGPFDRGGDGRPFKPGQSGNPEGSSKGRRGRPPGQKPHRVVLWDLQQAAKDKSKRGLEILEQCMEDTTCDWPTRMRAFEMLWERGYGRPQQSIDMNLNHNFAEVPAVMGLDQWLERKGQPMGHDAWLLEHQKANQPATTEKRTCDGPSEAAGASSGPPVIDLKAEEALLLAKDPTEPPPPGSKLN